MTKNAVQKCARTEYFGNLYIKRDRWLKMWQKSTCMPQITQVDIRAIKNSSKGDMRLIKAFAEACKYSVKEWSLSPKQIALIQSGDLKVDFLQCT